MQGSPCNKCRQGVQAPGDSWCIGCSSLELAQTVLKVRWRHPGLRRICEETALSCARLCKAFQNLDRTLLAEEDKREEVLDTTAPKVKAEKPRSRSRALRSRSRSRRGRAASSAPARPAGGEELPTGDTDDSEYTWEDDDERQVSLPGSPCRPGERAGEKEGLAPGESVQEVGLATKGATGTSRIPSVQAIASLAGRRQSWLSPSTKGLIGGDSFCPLGSHNGGLRRGNGRLRSRCWRHWGCARKGGDRCQPGHAASAEPAPRHQGRRGRLLGANLSSRWPTEPSAPKTPTRAWLLS